MSSRMKNPRPYVDSTRSLNVRWICIHDTGAGGRSSCSGSHCSPSLNDTYSAFSSPRYRSPPDRILAHDARKTQRRLRDSVDDLPPLLPVIARAIHPRVEVVFLVTVHRQVRGARVMTRRLDVADRPLGDDAGDVARHVGPRAPAISRQVHEPVIRPRPDQPARHGRF
jgi:hypothetical protein